MSKVRVGKKDEKKLAELRRVRGKGKIKKFPKLELGKIVRKSLYVANVGQWIHQNNWWASVNMFSCNHITLIHGLLLA